MTDRSSFGNLGPSQRWTRLQTLSKSTYFKTEFFNVSDSYLTNSAQASQVVNDDQPFCPFYQSTLQSSLPALSKASQSWNNISAEDVLGPRYASTLRIVLIGVMLVVSLFGNLTVCFKLLTSRRHRYFKAQVLFLNLALADLLVTLVTMSSQLVWEVMGRLWIAGDLFCRLFKVLQTFSLVSSTYMLVSVAIDRHFAIVHPLSQSPKPRSLALGAWVLSLVPSLPNIFVFRLVTTGPDKHYCASLFYIQSHPPISRQMYMAFVFSFVFIIPLVLLIGLYTTILLEMWRLGGCEQDSLRRNSAGNTLPRARVRTLRMTIVIFVAFLVTNIPYIIQEMILAFAKHVSMDRNLVAIFGVISASNSAVNPYVYLAFNAKPKTSSAIWDLFGKLTGSRQRCRSQRTPVLFRFKAKPLNQRQDLLLFKSTDMSCQDKHGIKLAAPDSGTLS